MLPLESAFYSKSEQPLRVLNADLNHRLTTVCAVWRLLVQMGLNPYWQDLRRGTELRPLIVISEANAELRRRCRMTRLVAETETTERYYVGELLGVDVRWPLAVQ